MHILPRTRFRKSFLKQKIIFYAFISIIALTLLGFIISFGIFAWYAKDLPSPGKLAQTTSNSTIFLDREDKVLFELYKDKNRVPIVLADVSDHLRKATVSIEDKNFYKHRGVSETGIVRALINIALRRGIQGGSTITQQLIKNTLLDSRRTLSRKIRELILAFEVERRYTKDEILEMYLNEAPYGGSLWGVGAAAKGYFDKEPKNLTILESAILAGLPQRPSYYSPYIGEKNAWKFRTKDVLRRLREDGYISKKDENDALKKLDSFEFSSEKLAINAPHFVFYVRDLIEKEYGEKIVDQGVKIKTTLSLETQKTAEKIIREEIEKLRGFDLTNSAAVVLDSKSGEILAMVGSYDFNDTKFGKFNASLGLRQPGSTLKPITYALAFEKGYTPSTVITDVKTVFPKQGESDYIPVNYDGKFRGPIQLRFALGNSVNIPAVKLLAMVGIRDFLQKAADMGLSTLSPTQENLNRFGLAVTLGGGETTLLDLTSAFSVFASGGIKKETTSLLEIEDFKSKPIFKRVKTQEKKVLSQEAAFLISHILSDNNARLDVFGANSFLNIPGKTAAVKTGTSDDKRDNWAVGFTKGITVGVWSGNNDNSPMNPKIASGATGASQIFYRLMIELLKKYADGIMDKPDKVKAVTIDSFLGGLAHEGVSTRSEYFIDGSEPKELSPYYKKIKISKSTGKIANDVEIKTGNYEEKEFIVISENDPISPDGKNRWQEAINEWSKQQSDDKYHPPTETSDASGDVTVVQLKEPADKATLNTNDVTIKGKIASVFPIKNVKLYINGSEIRNYDENKKEIEEKVNLTDGVYEIRLVATSEKDKTGDSIVKIGINQPWDALPASPSAGAGP